MSAIAMQKMGERIQNMLPKDYGFMLLVFPYNNANGEANYISSANREDMINHLRNTANVLESEEDYETPENNIY
jgi:hypothetical protein